MQTKIHHGLSPIKTYQQATNYHSNHTSKMHENIVKMKMWYNAWWFKNIFTKTNLTILWKTQQFWKTPNFHQKPKS